MRGLLVYLVGASGVGKDTVLGALRASLRPGDRTVVAHRYITRAAGAGAENHVALSEREFRLRLEAGCFALNWESHGLQYGIGCEIEGWLASGLCVLVNGSRAHWPAVRMRFPDARLVEITASAETIRARLAARGRESASGIEARLRRNGALAAQGLGVVDGALRVANDGRVEDAVAELLGWLRGESAHAA